MADEEPAQNAAPDTIQEEAETTEAAPTEEQRPAEVPAQEVLTAPEGEVAEAAPADGEAPAEGQEPVTENAEVEQALAVVEPPADGEQPVAEGEQTTVEGEQAPAEQPPAEGEQVPVEGEAKPEGEEGEDAAPTEGEEGQATEQAAVEGEPPADGEPPTEGEPPADGEPPAEGELPVDGEQAPVHEGEAAAEDAAPTEGEAARKSPVPQSDTFEEGDRPESPVGVGEKLSREGTPIDHPQLGEHERTGSPPIAITPEPGGEFHTFHEEDEDEDDEEYDDEPQYDREQLINRYHQALTERQQLQDQNYQLQHKLAEHFRKKKADERQDVDKNVTDQEQRYLKYMANLDELRRQDAEERDMFKHQIEEMQERCEDKGEHVSDERLKFIEFKKQIALNAVNGRSGKPIPPRDVEQHFINESRKEEEVVKVRLENIKLKNKLKKKELQLKSKEELAEGLHMIDFEQLKIENQTYNEKIEERNEELLKLRRKITSTVQVLTHLKEKLQFVQGENGGLSIKLKDVEELAGRKRDILSRTKQARDALRIDNQRLRQNCGLLGNEPLLRDFEERKDESDDLKVKLDQLKMQHAELTLNLTGVRRKIEQAKEGQM